MVGKKHKCFEPQKLVGSLILLPKVASITMVAPLVTRTFSNKSLKASFEAQDNISCSNNLTKELVSPSSSSQQSLCGCGEVVEADDADEGECNVDRMDFDHGSPG